MLLIWFVLATGVAGAPRLAAPHALRARVLAALPVAASAPDRDGARGGARARRRTSALTPEAGRRPTSTSTCTRSRPTRSGSRELALSALCVYPMLRAAPAVHADVARAPSELRRAALHRRRRRAPPARLLAPAGPVDARSPSSSSPSSATTPIRGPPRTAATSRSRSRPRYAAAMSRVDRTRRPLDVRTPARDRRRAADRRCRRSSAAAPPARCSRTASPSAGARWSSSSAGGTSTRPSSPRTSARSSPTCTPTAGCSSPATPASRCSRGCASAAPTVVNNAVCFDLPDHVLERWNDPDGLDAGLDEAGSARSFETAARMAAGDRPEPTTARPRARRAKFDRGRSSSSGSTGRRASSTSSSANIRRLLRLRLLQHRLPVRQEALGARHDPAPRPARVRRGRRSGSSPSAWSSGSTRRQRRLGRRSSAGSPTAAPLKVSAEHRGGRRRRDRLEPDPAAQRPRRPARRQLPQLQHGRADDRRSSRRSSTPTTASRSPTTSARRTRTGS